jgi:hypothetical protein
MYILFLNANFFGFGKFDRSLVGYVDHLCAKFFHVLASEERFHEDTLLCDKTLHVITVFGEEQLIYTFLDHFT